MSGQLPPIDQDLRAHLARRSAGRLPEGLADQVLQAVDAAPVKPRYAWRAFSPRSGRTAPRTLLAGASVAAVLLLAAALVVVPRFQVTPAASGLAGYPADRALTTAELAALMAGPALPTNTALVAKVTIDPKTDVCPMDRYGTLGVVDGMSSQVCVMGTFDPYASRTTATFAFRYLAPGYLGLLGAIVSPSELGAGSTSKLAFRASEQWPNEQSGKPFLVEGWLGSSAPPQSVGSVAIGCTQPLFGVGDPLDPAGPENTCKTTWLADDPSTAPSWEITGGKLLVSVQGGHEVGAGGARFYDSIPNDSPVKGVYVVRSEASAVSCALPSCGKWVVMAKVAEISLPQATATPLPTPSPTLPAATPPTGYPADRALTAAELAAVMAGPAVPVDTTLVAAVTIDSSESGASGCVPTVDYSTIGLVHGMPTRMCVFGGGFSPARVPGVFAFRYLGPGALYLMAQITPASSSRLAFHATEAWPWGMAAYITFLAGGYLERGPTGARIVDILNGPTPPGFLSSQRLLVDPTAGLDSIDPSQYGVFVVTAEWVSVPASSMGPTGDGIAYHVIAQVADISLPGATPPASPTSTTAPPATPIPFPTVSPVAAPTALMGLGNRPLTAAEFATLWATDPTHLAGRIAIVKGPVPTGFECSGVGPTGSSATSPRPCSANVVDGRVAPEGYWAIRAGSDGMLSVVGELSTPGSKFVVSLEEARAVWKAPGSDKAFVLVDAWIGGMGADACDVVGQPCYEASWLAPAPEVSWVGSSPADGQVNVQPGAYHMFGAGSVGGGPPIQAVFLVQGLADEGQVVARMEVTVP